MKLRTFKYFVILVVTFATSGVSFYVSKMIRLNIIGRFSIAINLTAFAVIYLLIWFILISIFRKDLIEKMLKRVLNRG